MGKRHREMSLSRSRSKNQLDRIYERDNGICQYCHKPCSREDASRGHILELRYCATKAEARDINNMQLEHKWCNHNKEKDYDLFVRDHLRFTIGSIFNV
jgi:5-methylcytosine-specific restriction endonuclease McrA